MKESYVPGELYGPEWFKERAAGALRRLGPDEWDFSDSLLLYTPSGEDEYVQVQSGASPYHEIVTAPEHAYLAQVAWDIVATLPDEFEYIDLGPGTEHKEQFFFDAARMQGKKFTYTPIDISEYFLEQSRQYAAKQGIGGVPVRASFEELLGPGRASVPRVVSLGLTYSNYDPKKALALLQQIAGRNGYALINSQIRERTDTERLKGIYAGMRGMFDGKLALLGLKPEDIDDYEATDEVKVWCRVKNVTPALQARGMKPGDRLLVLQSLRPSRASLEEDLAAVPHQSFDTGGSFVATLLTPASA